MNVELSNGEVVWTVWKVSYVCVRCGMKRKLYAWCDERPNGKRHGPLCKACYAKAR